jgi:hypothetical protein
VSSTAPDEAKPVIPLPEPPRERLRDFVRRWMRSRARYAGLGYWWSFQGLVVFVVLGVLFLVNGLVNGWELSYNVLAQLTSPWGDPDQHVVVASPWLALVLALAGYLAVPSIVGALVGYLVNESSNNRRERPAPEPQTAASGARGGRYIPRLESLFYAGHGQSVPANFAQHFVEIHNRDWGVAQRHWEIVVERSLNSDAVERYAPPKVAMRQAVSTAATILTVATDEADRCPECVPEPTAPTEPNGSDEE